MGKRIYTECEAGSSPIFVRRVTGNAGTPILATGFSGVYTIYELSETDKTYRGPVAGHEAVPLTTITDYIIGLTLDELWQDDDGNYLDQEGYNFKFQPNSLVFAAFPQGGKEYLLMVTLTPASGQKIFVPWIVRTR